MRLLNRNIPPMTFLKRPLQLFLIFFIFSSNLAFADDVGINSARLIQLSDTSYLFETEFLQAVVVDYELPVFPERFSVSAPEAENQSGLITIKNMITTSGEPLNSKDEILLPWRRNGIGLTVQWLDGTLSQGLFLREMDGIRIPINTLMPSEKSFTELISESFSIGLNHLKFGYLHFLLVLALVMFLPRRKLLITLIYYVLGSGLSIILVEFGLPGFDLLYIDLLILLIVVALSITSLKNSTFKYLSLLMSATGLLHGLSVANELSLLKLPLESKLLALFVCNLTIDAGQFIFALIVSFIVTSFRKTPRLRIGINYLVGVIAVFLIIWIFKTDVITGEKHILLQSENENNTALTNLANQNTSKATTRPQAAMRMTNPILSYVSIEPFEVRHEILITAKEALDQLNSSYAGMEIIPIDSLSKIKDQLIDLFAESISLKIDNQNKTPIQINADFITLGLAGVLIRGEPVAENLETAILGVSFIYETEKLADKLSLNWVQFPKNLAKIDATTIDPFGGANLILTPDDPMLYWEASLSGYTVPKVEEVAIESPRVSLISFILFIVAIILLLLAGRFKINKIWAFGLIAIGLILYPLLRSPLNIDFIKQWKPSNERSEKIVNGLLVNVYRSFDYRNESDVYDRLAISVVGDQLTQTYIEQRKGLEIENRGGAKAKVNDVEVLDVYDIQSGPNNDYGIEVEWKINGSVSHFGHMHYRQNRYRAIIWILPDNGNWKIENIEMLDEERLM